MASQSRIARQCIIHVKRQAPGPLPSSSLLSTLLTVPLGTLSLSMLFGR